MSEKATVFGQWIEQHSGLKSLLRGEVPSAAFQDTLRWNDHSLKSDFSLYLATYSASILKHFGDNTSDRDLSKVVSYLQLFASDDQQFLEQKLSVHLFQKLQLAALNSKNCRSEADLLTIVDSCCNEDTIAFVAALSRRSYPLKVQYVDEVLAFVNHPVCTARLAYRLVKQLKELELNPEHRAAVLKVENDLKSGALLYDKKRAKVKFRSFVRPLLFITVIAGIAFGIYYFVEHNKQDGKDLNIASSFEDFTKEERMKIDSLIKTMRTTSQVEEEDDIFQWLGNGVTLTIREPLNNRRMEQMYNDWLLDAALIENANVDTCVLTSDSNYPGVLTLSNLKAQEKIIMRNESAYQAFVFVFDDNANGKVHSLVIEKGKTINFFMNTGQGLLVVPGNKLAKFIAPGGIEKEECPSKSFTTHFCETDGSLNLALSSVYRLSLPADQNKLMLVGDSVTQFSVIDLNGILETY